MLGAIVQVFVAIAIIIIMFVIAFSVYNMEFLKSIQEFGKVRNEVSIFSGIKDLHRSIDEVYDTMNKNSPLYLPFLPSYNQSGGTEYSYNFWLYLDPEPAGQGKCTAFNIPNVRSEQSDSGLETYIDSSTGTVDDTRKPIVLFLKGNTQVYNYTTLCSNTRNNENPQSTGIENIKSDILIKSPLVKLERGCDVLTVEFNTYSTPDAVKQSSRNTCTDISNQWEYMNAYKVGIKNLQVRDNFKKRWFMISIVLQDTLPTDPYPIRNKIRCVIYVNGTVELDRYIDGKLGEISTMGSVIKLNNGKFFFNPTIKADKVLYKTNSNNVREVSNGTYSKYPDKAKSVLMADLKYFNYAINQDTVMSLFNMGITKKYAPVFGANQNIVDENEFMNSISYSTNKKTLLEINENPPNDVSI